MPPLRVHSVETFGTHDGPGIRLVLFLQGCNIRCLYCHNPDTQSMNSTSAHQMNADEVVALLQKEKNYFSNGGGLTISGGEPTVQAAGVAEVMEAAQNAGFNTVLDTNGTIVSDQVKKVYAATDLLLLDVKHIDDGWHRRLTGASNVNTLKNAAYRESTGLPMWLRYVLVPGYSDQTEFMKQWAQHFADYQTIQRVEILPYHTLGVYKYKQLGRTYKLANTKPPTAEKISEAKEIFEQYLPEVMVQ